MSSVARLCLNMIVKDEAAIIQRCLEAVAPVIDHYVICDTGSSDETVAQIRTCLDGFGIPGEIHAIPFGDFGRARNEALRRARESEADFDYILLTDADMELQGDREGLGARLGAEAYAIRQTNGLSYFNTRLLRRDVAAHYVGATHEYLAVAGEVERLEGVWFRDHACGSSRADKILRDIGLLSASLERDPADARSLFYLAQTYRDAGRFEEALDCYR